MWGNRVFYLSLRSQQEEGHNGRVKLWNHQNLSILYDDWGNGPVCTWIFISISVIIVRWDGWGSTFYLELFSEGRWGVDLLNMRRIAVGVDSNRQDCYLCGENVRGFQVHQKNPNRSHESVKQGVNLYGIRSPLKVFVSWLQPMSLQVVTEPVTPK